MAIDIFSQIGNIINSSFQTALDNIQRGYVSDLIFLSKIAVTVYIMIYGYAILAGKKNNPIADILWDLSRLAIILSILQGAGGIMSGLVRFVDELKTFFIGGKNNPYSLLDVKLNIIANIATEIFDQASGITGTLEAILKIVGLLPLLVGFITCGALIIYTEIVSKILLAAAPIFIFCLMWGFLKDSFSQWIEAILSNCFVLLFTTVTMQLSFELATIAALGNVGVWHRVALYIVAGLLSIMAVKWGREVALSLAKVSVDRSIGTNSVSKTGEFLKKRFIKRR